MASQANTARTYKIEDDGDQFDIGFFIGGQQVAGACVPVDLGIDLAFDLAKSFGENFVRAGS